MSTNTTTATDTTANGIRIKTTKLAPSSHPARRFAAGLERDHPAIDRLSVKQGGDVTVWLTTDVVEPDSVHAPDGWAFKKAFVSSCGDACVRFEEVRDA